MDPSFSVIQEYLKGHQKRETRIQWLMEEDEQKELYDDLGIIGEISSPESRSNKMSFTVEHIRKAKKCGESLHNCKQFKFTTPSNCDLNMDVKLKRAMNRVQRKRSRQSKLIGSLAHAKIGKMDLSDSSHSRTTLHNFNADLSIISQLPDEVLLKVFRFCNSETRVQCTRVCWRWYHIANDESLWQQISLAKRNTNLYQLQRMLKRNMKILCLNCSNISQNTHDTSLNSSASFLDENSSFSASPRPDPFSRAYNYAIHSLDLTNAIVSCNVLCLVLSRCNQLRNLSLEGLTINHNVLGSLSESVMLERLNLCLCNDMTTSGLTQLLASCSKILELNLGWTNLCHTDPSQIIQALPCDLAQLNMSGFRETLKDDHVIDMVKRCPSLVEIDISDSNLLTGFTIDQMIERLSKTLRAVNLSRCYSISPNCFLRFSRLPLLRYLDVFGVMDDSSIGTLAAALPRVRVCLRPFSAIARPSPSALYGTKRRTIWGYLVV